MSTEDRGEEELSKIFASRLCYDNDSKKNAWETGEIPSVFESLECPFSWKYEFALDTRNIAIKIEEKLCKSDGAEAELLLWNSFILNLILCFEYARTGDFVGAIEKQDLCDKTLDDKFAIEGSSTVLYMGIGLRHISLACKCYLLYASNMPVDGEKIYNSIVPYDKLSPRDQASILGAKGAYCAEFGYRGIKESISIIQKAIDLDDSAEWFYLLGRSLGRLRRLENKYAIPEKRELQALEVCVEKTDNLSFIVLLAQSYRETSRCVFNEYIRNRESPKANIDNLKPYCDSLNKKSMEMYKKVLRKGNNDVYGLTRCALGLMKLPKPWRDLDEAKDCILKALDLAPENPMTNHVAGSYFNYINESKQAMHYFSKAAAYGVFGAELDLITTKAKKNKWYNPLADLERVLDVYKEKPYKETILCYLGTYCYVKNDIKTAFKYWFQVVEMDIHSGQLKAHYDSVSYNSVKPLNINKVIIEEIMKLLDGEKLSESETKCYNEIINKYILYHPSLISECTDIDVSKLLNQKFEYSSWKKEESHRRPSIISSSRNKNEIDGWSRNNFGGKNLRTDWKNKNFNRIDREVAADSYRENQWGRGVGSSSSQSYTKVSTSTASRRMEFEEKSNANRRGRGVHMKSHSRLGIGNFHGQIHHLWSGNQEDYVLGGEASSRQKQNWGPSEARGGLSAWAQGKSRGRGVRACRPGPRCRFSKGQDSYQGHI